ncbi:hypothetical protein [Chryseobacterium indoltheticum]|uniref:hypothetical protein n=1 Tax=Chryseobacterium indoltheticum TaxID=254 RepID=UPI003F499B18
MTILISITLFFVIITLALYIFGYGYLLNGISKTYLKGKTSANIDDGNYFTRNVISTKNPKPWEKADDYNKKELPKNIVDDLSHSNTASFLIVKDGKLVHEQYFNSYKKHRLPTLFLWQKR